MEVSYIRRIRDLFSAIPVSDVNRDHSIHCLHLIRLGCTQSRLDYESLTAETAKGALSVLQRPDNLFLLAFVHVISTPRPLRPPSKPHALSTDGEPPSQRQRERPVKWPSQ